MMNKSELAKLMLRWEAAKRRLDEIEAAVIDTVLQLGETVEVGNVKASYSNGRKSYSYSEVGSDASPTLIARYTKTVEKTDWRKLVLDGMQIAEEQIPFTQSEPSVKVILTG